MPDRLLVLEPSAIGAIGYQDLNLNIREARFVEDEGVPHDATVVASTWRYVNKSGGPDRRFKDNHEIPICVYEEIHLSSPRGLNEVILISRRGGSAPLRQALSSLRSLRLGERATPSPASDRAAPTPASSLIAENTEKSLVRLDGDGSFAIEIVGESRYQNVLDRIAGGKTEEGHRKHVEAMLIHEDRNPYDKNAVAVAINGEIVGYLNRDAAREYRLRMTKAGFPGHPAVCDAEIVGGWRRRTDGEGHYGVRLDLPTT